MSLGEDPREPTSEHAGDGSDEPDGAGGEGAGPNAGAGTTAPGGAVAGGSEAGEAGDGPSAAGGEAGDGPSAAGGEAGDGPSAAGGEAGDGPSAAGGEAGDASGVGAGEAAAAFSSAGAGGPGAAGRGLRGWWARHRAKLRTRSRWRVWGVRTAITIVVVVAVVVAATAGYTVHQLSKIHKFHSNNVVPVKGPSENILLIGSTSRCAAGKIAQFEYQCLEESVNGVNSDVVLLMHLDGNDDKVSILSIPRDTFVPDARSGSALCGSTWALTPGTCSNKIDSALAQGPDQLSAAIEQDFGVPINHIVDLNFATFESVVNALGGLWMYFPDRLVDASSGLDIHHTGCIHLNGSEALELVRARHMFYFTKGETPNLAAIDAANTANGPWYTPDSGGSYDGSGDLGRILRVHEFLKALAGQVAARGLGNLGTDNDLIDAVAPNLTVDSTFSDTDMVKLVLDYHGVDLGATPELTLPTINDAATYYYYGANYGDVIFPSEPQDQLAIDEFLGSKPPALALAPSSITVSVVDDTDSPATAAAVGSQLAAIGYQVVPTTVSNDVGPVAETTVLYDGPSHLAQAERVESSLHGAVVLGLGRPAGGADVSVVTGSVLSVARPAALASTAPAKASARPAAGRRHEGAAHHSAAPATTSTSAPAASVTAAPGTSGATGSTATTPPTSTSGTTLAIPTSTNPSIGAPTSANPGIPSYDPVTCPRIPS